MGCSLSFNTEESVEDESSKTNDVVEYPLDTNERVWTLLVYMAADNNLEPYALNDICEMENSVLNTQAVTVLVLFDSHSDTKMYCLKTGRELGEHQPISEQLECPELNLMFNTSVNLDLSGSGVLSSFIQFGFSNYPAQNTGLIIWGHGNANGFAYDASSDKYLSTEQLSNELENGLCNCELDFIGFDTCSGGTPEVMYMCRNYAKYGTGSKGRLLSSGWNYQYLFNTFQKSDGSVSAFCDAVIQQFKFQYAFCRDMNIYLFDLVKIRNLYDNINTFLISYSNTVVNSWEV